LLSLFYLNTKISFSVFICPFNPFRKEGVVYMKKKETNLLYDVHETPPFLKWMVLALQHVFAMFGATILVPILVNQFAGEEILSIPMALFASGVGTIIYCICTKRKSPVYLGSSFAFISPIVAGYAVAGKPGVFTALACVGLVYVVIALIIKFTNKNWVDKLLPPIVVGPMIMIIGLSLSGSAISNIGIAADSIFNYQNVVVAGVTLLTTIIVAMYTKGFLKVIPFLTGIIAGYITAICFGMVDFTAFQNASFFEMPKFYLMFKDYTPAFGAILTIVPVALVTIAEHIGDHTALSHIIGKDLLKDPGLDNSLLGDGIATSVAAIMGGPANTTYGENTSVVGMTKIASIKVILTAAIFAIIIAFLGKLTALIGSIPAPVIGGVSILLYGFISVNGLKVLVQNQIDFGKTKNVVIAAVMLVMGLGNAVINISSGNFELAISGMSLAAILGILLNICLPEEKEVRE